MSEEISAKILVQTSDNIQRLFDVTTRIDERMKILQDKQEYLDGKIDDITQKQTDIAQKMAIIESQFVEIEGIFTLLDSNQKELNEFDKRMSKIEDEQGNHNKRWNGIASFTIQLVWVILAAYLLTKLNLQSPAIP